MGHSVALLQEAMRACSDDCCSPDVVLIQEAGCLDPWKITGWMVVSTPMERYGSWMSAAILVHPGLHCPTIRSLDCGRTVLVVIETFASTTVFIFTYLPPSLMTGAFSEQLEKLGVELGSLNVDRYVLSRDFNARLGLRQTPQPVEDCRGEMVIGFIEIFGLELHTSLDLPTKVHSRYALSSTIDLTFPALLLRYTNFLLQLHSQFSVTSQLSLEFLTTWSRQIVAIALSIIVLLATSTG